MSIRYIARVVVAGKGQIPTARMLDTPEQAADQVRSWVRRGAQHCSIMAVPAPEIEECAYALN